MIEISQTAAVTLYLCLCLGILLAVWACGAYRSRHHKINMAEKRLYICEYCQFCYLDIRDQPNSRCPQCRSYNSSAQ